MAIFARVRFGPLVWTERLDGPGQPTPPPTAAERRAAAHQAPRWAYVLVPACVVGMVALAFLLLAVCR